MSSDAHSVQTVMEKLPIGVAIMNGDGHVVEANDAFLRLLDLSPADLLSPASGSPLSEISSTAADRGHRKYEVRAADRFVMIEQSPIPYEQGEGMLLCVQDISSFRQLEQMKAEFVSGTLHKIRTPLTTIRSGLTLAAGGRLGALPTNAQKLIDMSAGEAARLTFLLDDLRDLLLIESGLMQAELDIEPVDVGKLVAGAVKDAQAAAEQKCQTITPRVLDKTPEVLVDLEATRRIVAGILRNSIAFSSEGDEVQIDVAPRGAMVVLAIEDPGTGISAADIPCVFDKYFRGDNPVTRATEGAGLGLFLAKQIVEMQQGEIYIDSAEGGGTTVELLLPVVK